MLTSPQSVQVPVWQLAAEADVPEGKPLVLRQGADDHFLMDRYVQHGSAADPNPWLCIAQSRADKEREDAAHDNNVAAPYRRTHRSLRHRHFEVAVGQQVILFGGQDVDGPTFKELSKRPGVIAIVAHC